MVPTRGIPYPAGDPSLSEEDERAWRRTLLETALVAISTHVTQPTVFRPDAATASPA
jgi:glycine reductase